MRAAIVQAMDAAADRRRLTQAYVAKKPLNIRTIDDEAGVPANASKGST